MLAKLLSFTVQKTLSKWKSICVRIGVCIYISPLKSFLILEPTKSNYKTRGSTKFERTQITKVQTSRTYI